MRNFLAVLAGLVAVMATLPYLIDIIKHKTKPNIVTWVTWTLLTGIATAAAFAAHQPRSAILTLADTICTFAVVVLGLRHGMAKLSLFDFLCQAAAVLGLVLWIIFNSPLIAIIASITIDMVVALPTYRHSWLKPQEETWQTYGLSTLASTLTLVSLGNFHFSGWAFPFYLLLSNAGLVAVIIYRRQQKKISLAR